MPIRNRRQQSTGVRGDLPSGLAPSGLISSITQHDSVERASGAPRAIRNRVGAATARADYREFPYALRRRCDDQNGEERIRLSEEVRRVQSRVSFYQAWTRVGDPTTGAAYNDLVGQLRSLAGASMRAAWLEPVLDNDAGMNIGPDRVNLSELRSAEEAFLKADENHVKALTTLWWRRRPKPDPPKASRISQRLRPSCSAAFWPLDSGLSGTLSAPTDAPAR